MCLVLFLLPLYSPVTHHGNPPPPPSRQPPPPPPPTIDRLQGEVQAASGPVVVAPP